MLLEAFSVFFFKSYIVRLRSFFFKKPFRSVFIWMNPPNWVHLALSTTTESPGIKSFSMQHPLPRCNKKKNKNKHTQNVLLLYHLISKKRAWTPGKENRMHHATAAGDHQEGSPSLLCLKHYFINHQFRILMPPMICVNGSLSHSS